MSKKFRRNIPSVSALVSFESAGRLNNFTKAAKELSTSQAAVSRHIETLEERFQCSLFERKNNRIMLTGAGRRLYHAVTSGLDEINHAIEDISQKDTPPIFRITCTYDVAHCWILPRYREMRANLENIDIQILASEKFPDFNAFETDMVICGDRTERYLLESAIILNEAVFPVCSPEFAHAHAQVLASKDLTALASLPLLALSKENQGWASWATWFHHAGSPEIVEPRAARYSNYTFLLEAAMAGEGLALGWEGFVDGPLASGQLIAPRTEIARTDFSFFAMWHRDHADALIVDKILKYLQSGRKNT